MPEPSLFRHYQIVQDADGSNIELIRDRDQVAVLAFDSRQLEFVHCHVLLEPLADKADFEKSCRQLQNHGHPLQARLMDFGDDEGNPFYITSSVDGETLKAYLSRQVEIPGWLAVLVAVRALEAVVSLEENSNLLPEDVLNAMRVVQTGPQQMQVQLADYALLPAGTKSKGLKPPFDKSAKMLRDFFQEHSDGGPTLPDQALPGADFVELLSACLTAADRSLAPSLRELKTVLQKLAPEQVTGEIPTAHKPRALLAPHFASYQEVARGVVNLVRIQSQRLDMSNPYSMRGTLTKTGRTVLVEQVPPARLVSKTVRALDEKSLELSGKREFTGIIPLVLLHEGEDITCLAEEMAEGVNLGDLLKERRCLSVHETYLVLAGLDGALDSLEKSGLDVKRLRLEDIFLLTGFPREDARTSKLMLTKLNEWPAFSVILRAHPTLAAMAGRGLDPAVLLPMQPRKPTFWNGAWLSAVGTFLVGLESIPGQLAEPPGGLRDRESISRLFDEEIRRLGEGKACPRADLLARYARILQHHQLVKPAPAPISEPLVSVQPKAVSPRTRTISATTAPEKKEAAREVPMALTSGLAPDKEKPTIGFAELLFRDTSVMESGGKTDWAKTAADAPPTIHPNEVLLPPGDFVPFWLRAAVFLGASLIAGGILAHLSGGAFWLKPPVVKAIPLETGSDSPVSQPPSTPLEPEPRGPAAPQVTIPTLPPEDLTNPSGGGLLRPPMSTLKDEL
ncbi:hypothetical protein WJU23_18050 [Prosthecobacter sp. SYSU 5D2]|uniref:hypothetical protein n=1 Tax=Prosthecobacter sp. SYSU 5D2 TaxID=3134134 RepID=UPI0031FEE6CF